MAARRVNDKEQDRPRQAPATTPQARERQMVALAIDLAEKQMREGSASAQVISHYLKLGSSREHLEQERIRHETALLQIKREALEAEARTEELYGRALNAIRGYQTGEMPNPDQDEY